MESCAVTVIHAKVMSVWLQRVQQVGLPYFFGYKTEFFFLSKQSQRSRSVYKTDLDPSYKTDLEI